MRYLLVVVMLFTLTACVPKMKNIKPSVELTVVDAKNLKVIANVLSSENIKSNEIGQLKVAVKRELGIAIPMGGIVSIQKWLAVGKKGYISQVCKCDVLNSYPRCKPYVLKLNTSLSVDEVTVESLQGLIQVSKKKLKEKRNDNYGYVTCIETIDK